MFERFTDRARRVLTLAQEEARLLNHSFIGTEHILLGVMREGDGLGAEALRSLGVSLDVVRDEVVGIVGASTSIPGGPPPFTPRAKKVLELSLREALQLNHSYIGTEHILLGLVREREGVAAKVLVNLGVDLSRVRQTVNTLMTGRVEPQVGKLDEELSGTTVQDPRPVEPSCSRCLAGLADAARFRTVSVPAEDETAPPVSMSVVYCTQCGSTLHMFGRDPNS
ncbi:MAG TPA: Clp protease N-terminal domain-containing protein [Acidimicrobiales bacterium]|nr:Clp protease N-terminal domain-containing protein [Acidimicrobiales bacterium]